MKKLWEWLGRNVHALEALGAVVVIIAAVVALWPYLQKAIKSDLLLEVQRNESTIPGDLIEWSNDVAEDLNFFQNSWPTSLLFWIVCEHLQHLIS